jgi:hypothetical protein
MSSRGLTVLVVVAVVAGIGVAAYGFATRGSGKSAPVLQIDEVNGRVGKVVLGETRANVIGALGKPKRAGTSPPIPLATRPAPRVLIYPHVLIALRANHVVSITTNDPAARTEKFVHMADPFSAVRATYRKAAKCIPNRPDKQDPHPRCTVKVPAGVLFITGDPIRAITLRRA